ncbi:MAG: MATE family efflux transporter [Peptococcaceae bacterium]|nr:MATE family efflux transporter [Peptococcaceae bacterium]
MQQNLTEGPITKKLILFALPLMAGNILQQLYNIVDTLIVGRVLGEIALGAVGSSFTLMTFLNSIIIGLCMGSSAYFSMQYGKNDFDRLRQSVYVAFLAIGTVTLVLNVAVYVGMDGILWFMRVPEASVPLIREYLMYIFAGILAVFVYNFLANLLRAMGNSMVPLIFLGVSAVLNIFLDLFFILQLDMGVAGAAVATILSQYISALGLLVYYLKKCPELWVRREHRKWSSQILQDIAGLSVLTCVQQSVMNFGILMVQGLVNSFGTAVMAAFTAAVKIDAFAYAPVQDFGNAFSTFVAQNYGAGNKERIKKGIKSAGVMAIIFCLSISTLVCLFAKPLMQIFIEADQTEIIRIGVEYLHIEGAFYVGIGLLFLFYGYYRAMNRPGVSVVLTVISLGTRVVLAHILSAIPVIGVTGIWVAIPIGWVLADVAGALLMRRN